MSSKKSYLESAEALLSEFNHHDEDQWWKKVLDVEEAKNQDLFSLPMILSNVSFLSKTLVFVMFAGHLGELQLAGATLANSWATVTGLAFMGGIRKMTLQTQLQGSFTTFVDNVSKRVPKAVLTEIFNAYGRVVDCYVAYYFKSRKVSKLMLAFVRFSTKREMWNAVKHRDNMSIDGSTIRVS